MSRNYSGNNTLTDLLLLIKNGFVRKEHKTGSDTEYRTMTDNNLTDTMKANYDGAYSHSTSAHAPSGAQPNVIESIKVNGSVINVEDKTVDIPVPLTSNDVSADKTSTTKHPSAKAVFDHVAAALASATGGIARKILVEGEYDADTGIPTVTGDESILYFVPAGSGENNVYKEYMYINGKFEFIGTTAVDLTDYVKNDDLVEISTEEVNAIWTSVFSS